MRVLAIDIGGTHVKILATGQTEKRAVPSGPTLTPRRMVTAVKRLAKGWTYDVVSMGYPGPVLHNRPMLEPHNLGPGWVGFDFARAFGKPVRILNDAAMQALGSYKGGRMLFLGLGTGLGTALVDRRQRRAARARPPAVQEGQDLRGLRRPARPRAPGQEEVAQGGRRRSIKQLRGAMQADYVVVGGGNAKKLDDVAQGRRAGRQRQRLPRRLPHVGGRVVARPPRSATAAAAAATAATSAAVVTSSRSRKRTARTTPPART